MLKRDEKDHNFIKGTLENKRKQRDNRKQNYTKIEIELNKHQINNTNYDVQSCNNDEASNSKGVNNEKVLMRTQTRMMIRRGKMPTEK